MLVGKLAFSGKIKKDEIAGKSILGQALISFRRLLDGSWIIIVTPVIDPGL